MSLPRSVLVTIITGAILSGCQTFSEKTANQQIGDTDTPDSTQHTGTEAFAEFQENNFQSPKPTVQSEEAPQKPVVDLWQVTRDNMALSYSLDNKRIQSQLNWYKKHPKYMQRVAKRASPYYHYIVTEVLKRGLPAELALLPIVESAFDPFAYSHGRAAGPWQFIPSTGKHFGLQQNWWYDGRRDIIRSTDAALTYLQQLNKRFGGDWNLALAAYNAGGGTVSLAIKKNKRAGKPTDYWSLNLPKETKAYVPKLIAISELIKNAPQYNLTLEPIANEPYFTQVEIGSQIDIAQAAAMAGISTKELYLLNPGFNRWATAPDGPHSLLVPVAAAERFNLALVELPPEKRVKWSRYKIKSGDSLIAIANKFDTSVKLIRDTNKIKGNNIRAGKTLLVPTASKLSSEYVLSQHQRHAERQKSISRTTNRKETYYKVRSGDSFWSIAKAHQVGVRQLARWNSMAPGDPLRAGKRLIIWSEPKQQVLSHNDRQIIRKIGYKVRSGDSLYLIANKFKVNIADIRRWNKLNESRYLQPGQRLTLFVNVTQTN